MPTPRIKVIFCFDGKNLPPINQTVLCIFSEYDNNGQRVNYQDYCTLLQNLANPEDKFWVKHNSLDKTRVYPQAWFGLPSDIDNEFMKDLKDLRQLTFILEDPYPGRY